MSFRARLTLAAAAAVAVAIVVASAVVYLAVRSELLSEVDEALDARLVEIERSRAAIVEGSPGRFFLDLPGSRLGEASGYVQVVNAEGETFRPRGADVPLPAGPDVRAVAEGRAGAFFDDEEVAGTHVRTVTAQLAPGFAVQVARPLTEVDDSLARIRTILLLVALGGIGLAAGLGLLVARTALAPVRRLTDATEDVTETRDLTRRIDDAGRDELSRLAASFNTMLAALEDAALAERRLVADASHELRTPLTSLRTNIEVLARAHDMPRDERERLLADVVQQLEEMTVLVAELVELNRGADGSAEPEDVRLDLLAADAVERARRNHGGVRFEADLDESMVRGSPGALERAIGNLLDNAAKWSPPGGEVTVSLKDGELVVRDQGPGIDDADLPHVFDRFYRAPAARGTPGSGLGLAIVRQVVESHGGEVSAARANGGGTVVRLRLPTSPAPVTDS